MRDTLNITLSLSRNKQPLDHMQYLPHQHISSDLVMLILSPIDDGIGY